MASRYNPYNDYRKIMGYKVDWNDARNAGRDTNYAAQSAVPYYQSLINNGYSQLADDLSRSDWKTGESLLEKYGLKPDNEYFLDQDYEKMTGQAATPAASTTTATPSMNASDIISASHPNDTSIDKLMNMGTGMSGMAMDAYNDARNIATGAVPVQPSAATQGLLDAYKQDYDRLNGQIKYDADGNVVSGLNTSHYNTGKQQLDYYNNFDITKAPYYQGIMDAYKLGGYNAAQGEYANGAANNGGNIDSYATANANRQQLAFTTAGQQAALAAYQQNAANWNNLYAQMSNDLANQGTLSLQTLDIAKQMYATDATERMNALDVEGSLASAQMQTAIQAFQALVQERMTDKGITAEMAMQDKDIAAAKEQLELQLASNERIQEGINQLGYYQTDAEKEMNALNNQTQRYGYDTQLAGVKDTNATQRYGYDTQLAGIKDTNQTNLGIAGIDANAKLGVAQIGANADLGVAGINADASKYAAGLNYDLNKYLGDLGYAEALAGYENALTLADLNNMSAYELQKLVNSGNLDVANANAAAKRASSVSGTSANPYTDITTDDMETAILNAVLTQNATQLQNLGITHNMTPDELRVFLMNEYNFSGSDANKIVKGLQEHTNDKGQAFVMLESMFPNISQYSTTKNTNRKNFEQS